MCIGFELIVDLLNRVAKIFERLREEMAGQEWWDPAQEKKGGPMKVKSHFFHSGCGLSAIGLNH